MTIPPGHDRPVPRRGEPEMRASDDDRAATVRVLQDAVVRGLLTPDEGSDRMAAAWAAVHLRDLHPLTADLPPARPAPTAPGWAGLATMAAEQMRSSLRDTRSDRLQPGRVVAVVAVVLLLVLLAGTLVGEVFDELGQGHGGFG